MIVFKNSGMKKVCIGILVVLSISSNSYAQSWKNYSDSAKTFWNQRNPDMAVKYYDKAREQLKKDSLVSSTYGVACYDLGSVYFNTARFNEAEPYYLEAQAVLEKVFGRNSMDYASITNYVGKLYSFMAKYGKAEAQLSLAKKILADLKLQETSLYILVSDNLGWVYRSQNHFSPAEAEFLEVKAIIEQKADTTSKDYADNGNSLGSLYRAVGRYEDAEKHFLLCKNIHEKYLGINTVEYAAISNNMGNFYKQVGKYDLSEKALLKSKDIRAALLSTSHPEYATSCNNLAGTYFQVSRYQEALALYLEAKAIREARLTRKHPLYLSCCDNLGNTYLMLGQFEKAEALYLEAKSIREEVFPQKNLDHARNFHSLATLYSYLGQFQKAEQYLLASQEIKEKILTKKNEEYVLGQHALGTLYMRMGEFDKVEQIYIDLKDVMEGSFPKEHYLHVANLFNQATLYYNTRQYDKSEKFALAAKDLIASVKGKENDEYAGMLFQLGVLYSEKNLFGKAESNFMEALQIQGNVSGKENRAYIQTCKRLADVYRNNGNSQKALSLYTTAHELEKRVAMSVFLFTNEAEKEDFSANMINSSEEYQSFLYSDSSVIDGARSMDVSLSNRNLILYSSQMLRQTIHSSADSAIIRTYNEWMQTREQLSYYYTQPTTERKESIKELEQKASTLEKELTRSSSAFRQNQEIRQTGWRKIKENLKTGEAAVEFASFQYYDGTRWTDSTFYVALVLRNDLPEPVMVRLFEKKQLESLLLNLGSRPGEIKINMFYKGSVTDESITRVSPYELIWKPIEKKLKGISTIYYAPSGLLYKIPFHALAVNNTTFLVDRYRLIQLNNITSLIIDEPSRKLQSNDHLQLYGGVSYDADSSSMKQAVRNYHTATGISLPAELLRGGGIGDWGELIASEKEINAIGKLAKEKKYQTTIMTGVAASEESVKSLSGKNSPAVLHLSTHGFFFPDPKKIKQRLDIGGGKVFRQSDNPMFRSGIILSGANNAWGEKPVPGIDDGILTAYEVSNMYLPNTKLVVLSACETGLGDVKGSEGVYGLQRAFKMAGAQNLMMSLWQVPDKETDEFMQEFYKNLLSARTIIEAFNDAQKNLKNKYPNEPFKWAAWVLIR